MTVAMILGASHLHHPEKCSLCSGVQNVKRVGEVRLVPRLHDEDTVAWRHLVRMVGQLLEDVDLVPGPQQPLAGLPAPEGRVRPLVAAHAEAAAADQLPARHLPAIQPGLVEDRFLDSSCQRNFHKR